MSNYLTEAHHAIPAFSTVNIVAVGFTVAIFGLLTLCYFLGRAILRLEQKVAALKAALGDEKKRIDAIERSRQGTRGITGGNR